jgi:hypothetical protein
MLELINEYAEIVPLSRISHHGEACCATARAWFLAMDQAYYSQNHALPSWLRQHHEWGPSRWPLYWCEAVEKRKLDCGALTALALEAFAERGRTAFPCQLIRKYDQRTVEQWRQAWEKAGCLCSWVAGEYAYHEACAILTDNRVEIWDPSGNIMVRPESVIGYESTVALRLRTASESSESVVWGYLNLPLNMWLFADELMPPSRCVLPSWRALESHHIP